ncbi:MAG: type III pantothenate kinase [Verrucomicrobiota bacterium]
MPTLLLIDNSNSRTKAALASPDALADDDVRTHPTPDLTPEALAELTHDWSYDRLIVSSVVPDKQQLITDTLGTTNTLAVSDDINLGITVDFPNPASIGADRLANAVAVSHLHSVPAVVIDFGTAVTFDIVSADNAYIGGVIAPGLDVMTDYLHHRTALLPKIDLIEPPAVIGKSTTDAMLAGVVHGYRGLIKEIISEIQKTEADPLQVVATGGYAALIAAKLPLIQSVHPNLTLEGLRLIANLNPQS